MTNKLFLVLLIILGLFLAALVSRNATLAWMTLPFLFYLAAGILSVPQEVHLGASRNVSHTLCETGTSITMKVMVENGGDPVPFLRIDESIEQGVNLTSWQEEPIGALLPGKKAELQYTFQAPRGRYHWRCVQVVVGDPFGLFTNTYELEAEASILVLPGRIPSPQLRFNPRKTIRAPGIYLSGFPGSGVHFFGVREYHPGDPLRWVHWKLSARHPGQLFSKEFEREEMADVGLILDGNLAANLKHGSEELFEYSIQAAAVLARSILGGGNRLSMLILGEKVVRVFPGSGKHQLEHVLDKLAACQPGESVSLRTLKYLPVKLFPSRALIILISPLRAQDIPAIARLLASRYQVIAVSPDPVKFISGESSRSLGSRLALVERRALLWRLRGMGAHVIDWPVTQQLIIEHKKRIVNY
jgi:uncharacterized protein (DUF58 family)